MTGLAGWWCDIKTAWLIYRALRKYPYGANIKVEPHAYRQDG